jgi:hypothetical protein
MKMGSKEIGQKHVEWIHVQFVQKVTVHVGYSTQIWLSVSKLSLNCAVV